MGYGRMKGQNWALLANDVLSIYFMKSEEF